MRKIILNLAVSLDGFIEGPNGEYDWCFTDQDYGMKKFLENTDTIFFGRKSYDLIQSVDPGAYPDKKKYVFSRSLTGDGDDYTLIKEDYVNKVKQLKQQPGKDIWMYGGASLTTGFINEGLMDELMLSVHPVILGQGKPLFTDIKNRVHLQLMDTKTFSSGLVQLFYRIGGS
jgi:dihydrofolate reductase